MRHVFITARPQPIPRWLEAFPDARLIQDQDPDKTDLAPLADASVVWLHVTEDPIAVLAWFKAVRSAAPNVPIVVLSTVPEDDQG